MDFVQKIQKYYILTKREGYWALLKGLFFNRHRLQFETGNLQKTFSNVYYFLPSTTDRSEEINRHMHSLNPSPTDIPEKTFEIEDNAPFDPSKLDIYCPENKVMTETYVKMLKKWLIYQIRIR